MDCIEVSPEMTTLIGSGSFENAPKPADYIQLSISPDGGALQVGASSGDGVLWCCSFLVSRAAVERLGGRTLLDGMGQGFHLPTELRAIVMAIRTPPVTGEAAYTYRLAKSIEFLCEAIRLSAGLVPLAALSQADCRRVLAARRMIDERWGEKLTLETIARACGLNRAKLTRGFREMFDCTIAEALSERRLSQASRLLLTTDLPVSSVGYESGYLNNASFTRAFGRHFGRSPSDYRACRVAA